MTDMDCAKQEMQDDIDQGRRCARDLLKPTAAQWEHGLELHRHALVFDSYGFTPRAGVDAGKMAWAARNGASDKEVQDLREDMTMTRKATDPESRALCLGAWDAAGVTCVFQNAGVEHVDPGEVMKRLARYTYVSDLLRDKAPRAACPDDMERAHREGKHAFYMSANAVPLPQTWISVEEELGFIRVFFQMGIRMMHLTYNRRNVIGDGCAEPANGGLSDFGGAVIREMNRVGVMVDVAHSGFQTSLDAARLSERPIVASHTGCHALSGHFRCKPDDVIKAIAATGGFCGVCCIPHFLGGTADIRAFLDHIVHMVKLVGADHVAIGTDVCYTPPAWRASGRKLPPPRPKRPAWSSFWPKTEIDDERSTRPEQRMSMQWTNWPLFTVGLVQRGLSDGDIQKILGLNVMRVARACWDQREP